MEIARAKHSISMYQRQCRFLLVVEYLNFHLIEIWGLLSSIFNIVVGFYMNLAEWYVEKKIKKHSDSFGYFKNRMVPDDFSLGNVFYGDYSIMRWPFGRGAWTALWYVDKVDQDTFPIGYAVTACSGFKREQEFGALYVGDNHVIKAERTAKYQMTILDNKQVIGEFTYSKKSLFFLLGSAKFSCLNNQECAGKIYNNYSWQCNPFIGHGSTNQGGSYLFGNIKWTNCQVESFLSFHPVRFRHKSENVYHENPSRNVPFALQPRANAEVIMKSSFVDNLPLENRLFILFMCCHSRMFFCT